MFLVAMILAWDTSQESHKQTQTMWRDNQVWTLVKAVRDVGPVVKPAWDENADSPP